MRRMKYVFLLIFVGIFSSIILSKNNIIINLIENKDYKVENSILGFTSGTYTSDDGKFITVDENGIVKYLNTYTLTVTESATGNKLSGKVGTNSKTATFYQLNDTTIVSSATINYTYNGVTEYLYDYTTFKSTKDVTPYSNGNFELWNKNNKLNTYKTLQDAIDSASAGYTIKITKDFIVTEGATINKSITIDGNNNTLDKSKWFNPVFVIEENATVNINNLTIDGGENTFEIDFSTTTPSIKDNTLNTDVKSQTHTLISKGVLNTDKLNIQNNYTVSEGTLIRILRGKANIKNGKFNHNYGNELAVVIRTGSNLRSSDTRLPVEELIVENCEFNNNYVPGGSGGAILLGNTTTASVNNSKFYRNIVTTNSSGGGAIYYDTTGQANSVKLNVDYPTLYVENSIFEENYSGNDGFAISNDSAHMYINNSSFIGNVGLSPTSSVGTVSCMNDGNKEYEVKITNSSFLNNKGAVNGYGDHGTLVDLEMDNVLFDGNEGNISILIYQANAILKNLTFKNSTAYVGLIDIRTHYNASSTPKYQPNTVTLRDITFENNTTPADIFIRKNSHNTNANIATVNIEGTVKGDIDIIDGQRLNINGALFGNVHSEDTLMENIITESSDDKSSYTLNRYSNHYIVTLNYNLQKDDLPAIDYLYLEKGRTYTEKEIFMLLKKQLDGYTMKLYTDNTYTNSWSYTGSSNISLYGRWEEHEHTFDGTLIKDNNKIYEQCILGHLGKEISLLSPLDTSYTGKEIPVRVVNTLNVEDYKIVYYVDDNGEWKEINSAPKDVGKYKAVLTYNNLSIEQEYTIQPNNPNTETSLIKIISLILIVGSIILLISTFKNTKINRYE